MFGILGEHLSDTTTLKVIVCRLAGDPWLRVSCRDFDGAGNLLNKGKDALLRMADLGVTRFIVCHDADGDNPAPAWEKVRDRIVKPANLEHLACILIPVQALEAWLLADIQKVTNIIPSWRPKAVAKNPESIAFPKQYLERISKNRIGRRLYDHVSHNERLAAHIDLVRVARLCPSFRPLVDFVKPPDPKRTKRNTG